MHLQEELFSGILHLVPLHVCVYINVTLCLQMIMKYRAKGPTTLKSYILLGRHFPRGTLGCQWCALRERLRACTTGARPAVAGFGGGVDPLNPRSRFG